MSDSDKIKSELRKLRINRGQVKGQLTRANDYFSKIDTNNLDNKTITSLRLRLEKIQVLYDTFIEISCLIEQNVSSIQEIDANFSFDREAENRECNDFEAKFFELVTDIKYVIEQFCTSQESQSVLNGITQTSIEGVSNSTPIPTIQANQPQVKLPTISLPKFSGQFTDWVEFRDCFKALIDENNSLANVQKFYYLRTALEKDALAIIESLPTTNDNYPIAFKLLNDRFNQENLIIHSHLKEIFEYQSITRESSTSLRNLIDTIKKHLRALKTLGQPTEYWDTLLIYLIMSKVDNNTRREWEIFNKDNNKPNFDDLEKYFKQRCEILEKIEINKYSKNTNYQFVKKDKPQYNKSFQSYGANVKQNSNVKNYNNCYVCKGAHSIYKCDQFLTMAINERITLTKRLGLCYNCLKPGHSSNTCSSGNCRKCGGRHNSLLHKADNVANNSSTVLNQDSVKTDEIVDNIDNNSINQAQTICKVACSALSYNSEVLLATAIILIKNKKGNYEQCRTLLDSGSQQTFIATSLQERLQLPMKPINCSIITLGNSKSKAQYYTNIEFKSRFNSFTSRASAIVIDSITDQIPSNNFSKHDISLPDGINLADPNFNLSQPVELLLGSTTFWELLFNEQIQLTNSDIRLTNSKFGWIITGEIPHRSLQANNVNSINCFSMNHNSDNELNTNLQNFWKIEEVSGDNNYTKAEQVCEQHFKDNYSINETGQFIVKLPLKPNVNELGDSKQQAINRFLSLERKLTCNENVYSQYKDFMQEYEQLNHMSPVQFESKSPNFYLPHHPIIRNDHTTTKLRVVFDASAKSSSGISLNDVQYVGPTIQSDIYSILLRYRSHKYVLTADISKMYRMIQVHEEHRPLQQIIWRNSVDKPLQVYQLNTVTYGTAAAPFLATRCLFQLGLDHEQAFPEASKIIKRDFSVDDLLTGCDNKQQLIKLQRDINNILNEAGFSLRKWSSNCEGFANDFDFDNNLEHIILQVNNETTNKILGIHWSPINDTIQYSIKTIEQNQVTKRTILSAISRIYDPLGLLAPIIITSKLLIQNLWQRRISWDEEVCEELRLLWYNFCKDFEYVQNVTISRNVLIDRFNYVEIHAFADASEKAYGTCIYIRSLNNLGQVCSNLLTAKSRVAPIKQISLPRLELCAGLLAAELVKRVTDALDKRVDKILYWSDSMVMLHWLHQDSNKLKTFVGNRVSKIQELSDVSSWHYVSTKENPADIVSRGLKAERLIDNKLWWNGPEWLLNENINDKMIKIASKTCDKTEFKVNVQFNMTIKNFDILNKFSHLNKLVRVMAYVLRYINNLKNKVANKPIQNSYLSVSELKNSEFSLVRIAQIQSFPEEYNLLLNKKPIAKHSKLNCLNPFLDDNNIIRLGGRIQRAMVEYDQKYPIILPANNHLTKLILRHEHERLLHCGPSLLLATIRQRYWPIHGLNIAKQILRQCVVCFKAKPTISSPNLMGILPKERLQQAPPFYNVGCDFAGPFLVRDRLTRCARGAKLIKFYICLFICMCTKAVHIECVSDLSTETFLASLRRFISRRGKPLNIFSDNGTNFIGANRQLHEITEFLKTNDKTIGSALATDHINWHFIPPNAPNFGGLWEANIKSVKSILRKIIGKSHVTIEEFNTLIVQIEGMLNSRPLCLLTSNPDDINYLTPAHFIAGRSMAALPEEKYAESPKSHLKRWQFVQWLTQQFWKKWHLQYLSHLQTRSKWKCANNSTIQIGSVVLIKDDNSSLLNWPMGIIVDVHPGADGIIRVASVRTGDRILKRPVTKLCFFPIDDVNTTS